MGMKLLGLPPVAGSVESMRMIDTDAMPRGFIGSTIGTGSSAALATLGSAYELTDARVVVPVQSTSRRYKIIGTAGASSASIGGLYRVYVYDVTLGAIVGSSGGAQAGVFNISQVGGAGQVNSQSIVTVVVAASTAKTFSVAIQRAAGGAAADVGVRGYTIVEDVGV